MTTETAPPSTLALAIGFTIVGAISGFFLGQASSIGVFSQTSSNSANPPSPSRKRKPKAGGAVDLTDKAPKKEDESSSDEDEDDEDDDEDGQEDPKAFEEEGGECKLVIVVRTDLGMGKGKIAAQASHATLAVYRTLQSSTAGQSILKRWERYGQAKVAVKCDSEEELLTLQAQAVSLGICAKVIQDAGRTQIAAGSSTVLGVGPAPKGVVDGVTGGLKLL